MADAALARKLQSAHALLDQLGPSKSECSARSKSAQKNLHLSGHGGNFGRTKLADCSTLATRNEWQIRRSSQLLQETEHFCCRRQKKVAKIVRCGEF